jgi:hypothetical protein
MTAYGYPVSLPNGIGIDSNGNVWIAEHYGNKIAEFVPSSKELVEYPIRCCDGNIASPYELAIGKNNTIWFVEITADSIGELRPTSATESFGITTESSGFDLKNGIVTIPITMSLEGRSATAVEVSMSVSGISSTGALENTSATFSPDLFRISSNQSEVSELIINDQGLWPGTYDLTVSANLTGGFVIYSKIISLRINTEIGSPFMRAFDQRIIEFGGLTIAVAVIVIMFHRRVK